jgi:hypothetical protein
VVEATQDECLTNQFLVEQAQSPAPRPQGIMEAMNLDEQMALEMARSAAGDAYVAVAQPTALRAYTECLRALRHGLSVRVMVIS